MFTFRYRYFILAIVLFVIEVMIAIFVNDRFIRPYFGDFLVVILMYCGVMAFIRASPLTVATGVLLFAYAIEAAQYLRLLERLGLRDNRLARTVIGYGFEWLDLLAYTLGIITVLVVEKLAANRRLARRGAVRS